MSGRYNRVPQSDPASDVVVNNNLLTVLGLMGIPIAGPPQNGSLLYLDPTGRFWSLLTQIPASSLPTLSGDVVNAINGNNVQAITGAGITSVNNAASPYTVANTDMVLLVDCTAGNVTVNIPPAVSQQVIIIRRIDSSANTLTLSPNGADVINGETTVAKTTWVILVSDKTSNWYTLAGEQDTSVTAAITALTGDGTAAGPGSAALTLATVNSNIGTFGDSSHVAQVTVNAKGLVTAASNVAITGATDLTVPERVWWGS